MHTCIIGSSDLDIFKEIKYASRVFRFDLEILRLVYTKVFFNIERSLDCVKTLTLLQADTVIYRERILIRVKTHVRIYLQIMYFLQ